VPDLVECVPNFSEGRRKSVVDALARAVRSQPGVALLDRTSDPDHNRSVLTFAGPDTEVLAAMEDAVATAVERIDMRKHAGQHPRIGAVDVVPFVPLGDTTIEQCIELAHTFGATVAARFDIPVYLYARAATRSERVVLADIRKPQFEGLGAVMGAPGWQPDYGPARLHRSAGAMAVGARPFLIAYNINLESPDLELAKRIAHRIRERSGGLPRVQALGLFLEELGVAQVSMNLLDFSVTPIWQVWEVVEELARSQGVALRESELIGLVPQQALEDVAGHADVAMGGAPASRLTAAAEWLRIRDFSLDRVLELRLVAARSAKPTGTRARGRPGALETADASD
jgi:glutamate formiminotransferase / 5-formyltetrahydrofolate cyclo-ligase